MKNIITVRTSYEKDYCNSVSEKIAEGYNILSSGYAYGRDECSHPIGYWWAIMKMQETYEVTYKTSDLGDALTSVGDAITSSRASFSNLVNSFENL